MGIQTVTAYSTDSLQVNVNNTEKIQLHWINLFQFSMMEQQRVGMQNSMIEVCGNKTQERFCLQN